VEYFDNLHDSIEIIKKNRVIKSAVQLHIRKISELYGTLNKCKISEDVEELIGKSNNHPDLLNKKKRKEKNVEIIEEHKNTVDNLFKIFCDNSFNAIEWIESFEIAYITKKENEALILLGYETIRPDHDKAYKEANINLKEAYVDGYYN